MKELPLYQLPCPCGRVAYIYTAQFNPPIAEYKILSGEPDIGPFPLGPIEYDQSGYFKWIECSEGHKLNIDNAKKYVIKLQSEDRAPNPRDSVHVQIMRLFSTHARWNEFTDEELKEIDHSLEVCEDQDSNLDIDVNTSLQKEIANEQANRIKSC